MMVDMSKPFGNVPAPTHTEDVLKEEVGKLTAAELQAIVDTVANAKAEEEAAQKMLAQAGKLLEFLKPWTKVVL